MIAQAFTGYSPPGDLRGYFAQFRVLARAREYLWQ